MKKILTILAAVAVVVVAVQSCSAQKIFSKTAKLPGVTSVYVGPAMMKLGMAFAAGEGDDFTKFARDIKSVEVLTSETAEAAKSLKAACDSVVGARGYEQLLDVTDKNETTVIYGAVPESSNNSEINGMLILTQDQKEVNLVYINGKIDLNRMLDEYGAKN